MCYTADRRKKGLEKRGTESLTYTAADKGYSGGTEELGLGAAAREAQEEESWFFQKPVISFSSWWARPEGSATKEAGQVDMEECQPSTPGSSRIILCDGRSSLRPGERGQEPFLL